MCSPHLPGHVSIWHSPVYLPACTALLHPLRRDSLPALGGEAHLEDHLEADLEADLEIEIMQAFTTHPSRFGAYRAKTASLTT